MLVVMASRYGNSQVAVFRPHTNYMTSNPTLPSFGTVNGIKIVPNAEPITSIKFTDTSDDYFVMIMMINSNEV